MIELPLLIKEDEEGGAELWVQALIGERIYDLLLDTGSAITSVALDEFTATFESSGIHQTRGVIGEMEDDLIVVPDFKVGSLRKSEFTIARASKHSLQRHNLLGMDFLGDYCCVLRWEAQCLIINQVETSNLNDLFLDSAQHPYVPVGCCDRQVMTVWDTGASLTCVDLGFIEEHQAAFQKIGESEGTDASGNTVTTSLFLIQDFHCGGYSFPEHPVVGIDLSFVNDRIDHPFTMILGYSTLRNADWIFDFPQLKWGIIQPHFQD